MKTSLPKSACLGRNAWHTALALALLLLATSIQAADWIQKNPAHKPPGRNSHAIAYDAARQQVVLFGGSASTNNVPQILSDTWVWDGNDWTQKFPVHSPPARAHHSMAYDELRGNVVLFGGANGGIFGDTWTWDGTDWTQMSPAASPPARNVLCQAMAFDAARGVVVLFGGGIVSTFDDTWTWDGTNWAQAFPGTHPGDRAELMLAYDQDHGNSVLFGGYQHVVPPPDYVYSDTWIWDGATWQQQTTSAAPPARAHAGLASDPPRSQMILFGGAGGGGSYDDTWSWNGTDWAQLSPTVHPSARDSFGGLAYDSERQQVVLFGGSAPVSGGSYVNSDETWVWGTTFTAQIQPPVNADGSSIFKAKRGVVPVKFTLSADGSSTCDLPPATISLVRTSGGNPGPVNESVYNTGADSGSNFRISDCQYIYNLGTSSLGAGSYLVNISIGGAVVGTAVFGLN